MTDIDITDLRAKLAVKTDLPWVASSEDVLPGTSAVTFDRYRPEDAALILAAVNALPALLDELERARAEAHMAGAAALRRAASDLRTTPGLTSEGKWYMNHVAEALDVKADIAELEAEAARQAGGDQ